MVYLPQESKKLEQMLNTRLILFFLWSSSCLLGNGINHPSLLASKDQIIHDPSNACLEIASLTKLGELNLANNSLTGFVPPSIGNLSSLTKLHLSMNHLHGSIPEEIRQLTILEYLRVSVNNLTATIPDRLYERIIID